MSTKMQSSYIADLAVNKTKEFKEVKELLLSTDIIGADADTIKNAQSMAEITNALDDLQASKFIDVLVSTKEPSRDSSYSQKRVKKAIAALDEIKQEISDWDFNT